MIVFAEKSLTSFVSALDGLGLRRIEPRAEATCEENAGKNGGRSYHGGVYSFSGIGQLAEYMHLACPQGPAVFSPDPFDQEPSFDANIAASRWLLPPM